MEQCPFCETKIEDGWISCPICSYTWTCLECKKKIESDWVICPFCGTKISQPPIVEISLKEQCFMSESYMDRNQIEMDMKEFGDRFKPWFETAVSKVPLSYPVTWILIGQIMFFFHYIIAKYHNESDVLFHDGSFVIIIFIVCLMVAFTYGIKKIREFYLQTSKVVNLSHDQLKKFYEKNLNNMFNTRYMLMGGVVVVAMFYVTLVNLGIWYKSPALAFSYLVISLTAAFLWGNCLMPIYKFILMIHKIGNLPLKLNLHHPDKVGGMRPFAELSLRFSMFAIGLSIIIIFWFIISPWVHKPTFFWYIVLFWIALGDTIGVLLFIGPLISIHNTLLKFKADELDEVLMLKERIIKESYFFTKSKTLEDINMDTQTKETIKKIDESFSRLKELKTWPFDFGQVSQLGVSMIIPLIVVTLDKLLGFK